MADLDISNADVLAILVKLTQPVEVSWIDNPYPRGSHKRWTWNFLKVCHFRYQELLNRFSGLPSTEIDELVIGLKNYYKYSDDLITQMMFMLHRVDEDNLHGNLLNNHRKKKASKRKA